MKKIRDSPGSLTRFGEGGRVNNQFIISRISERAASVLKRIISVVQTVMVIVKKGVFT